MKDACAVSAQGFSEDEGRASARVKNGSIAIDPPLLGLLEVFNVHFIVCGSAVTTRKVQVMTVSGES